MWIDLDNLGESSLFYAQFWYICAFTAKLVDIMKIVNISKFSKLVVKIVIILSKY